MCADDPTTTVESTDLYRNAVQILGEDAVSGLLAQTLTLAVRAGRGTAMAAEFATMAEAFSETLDSLDYPAGSQAPATDTRGFARELEYLAAF